MIETRVVGVVDCLLAQEYLSGGDDQLFFCLYLSVPGFATPITFSGRKLVQFPRFRGSTAACELLSATNVWKH